MQVVEAQLARLGDHSKEFGLLPRRGEPKAFDLVNIAKQRFDSICTDYQKAGSL
jgi:hypothetical protein